ncbi:antirepressor [Gordonia phage Clown]|uniref:Antirepressor n=1 Tax=Gordonia phage Clown TaxID=2759393 RepID=A0A7L7SPH3_9CAUD|nr:anti-repressor Ant [Gordonia phage Clown]QOC56057.1 antirepressor [Gordonia phage Clown]
MTTAIAPFDYQGHTVRTVVIDGEPWFVLADICKVLDIANVGNVADRLDVLNIRRADVENSRGQMRLTMIVNEPGMYEVVIRSDKPEAVAFRRWVTGTVLPEIRKTGSFNAQPALPSTRELAQMVIDAEDAREAAERQTAIEVKARQAMESYAKDLEPRAEGYDLWISGDGTYSIGTVAKMLGTSQNKLFDELRNAGVLIAKGAMRNTPYQKYMHHFAVKATEYERSDGTRGTSYTPRVQPTGVDFVARKVGRTVQAEVDA